MHEVYTLIVLIKDTSTHPQRRTLRTNALTRRTAATAASTRSLALPLPRQRFQLSQHLLDIFHAVRNAVGHRWRNRLFIVSKDKSRALERAQSLRQHSRRDALHLPPQHTEPRRAVVAQRPENVQRPGPRQQLQQPAHRAPGRHLFEFAWTHI